MNNMLVNVYAELFGSEAEFSKGNLGVLSGMLAGVNGNEYTIDNLYRIAKGYKGFGVTAALERDLLILGARLDGQSALQARAEPFAGFKVNGVLNGSFVFGHSARCPECMLLFVPNPGWRKFCPECRPPRKVKDEGK